RRYTDKATKIFKLIKSDVGRPITDLVSGLSYPGLANDARDVLRTLVSIQKQIPTKDNQWFSVRIMPYRTSDDRIDGLVITFVDNSDIKLLEGNLMETDQMHRLILNTSSDVIVRLSTDMKVLEFNPRAEKLFGKKHKSTLNKNFIQLFVPEPNKEKVTKDLHKILHEKLNCKYKTQVKASGDKIIDIEWSINILLNYFKKPTGLILISNM
ncbi:MAG: PAS domain-containing protein, partial [Bacteroidales bacterium]